MRDATRETVARLSEYPWFSEILQPLDGDEAVQVGSWAEALERCAGDVWQSVQLQISNLFAQELCLRNYERYLHWNDLAPELRTALEPILNAHVEPVVRCHNLPDAFANSVAWDVNYICLEAEFSDVCPPLFFLPRVDTWYRRGRFPCGWQGPKLETGLKAELPLHKLLVL